MDTEEKKAQIAVIDKEIEKLHEVQKQLVATSIVQQLMTVNGQIQICARIRETILNSTAPKKVNRSSRKRVPANKTKAPSTKKDDAK